PSPICGVMGDSQASLFAHRCFAPGSAKVTLGSGSSVLLNIGDKLKDEGPRMKDEENSDSSFILPPSSLDSGTVTTIAWTHDRKATYCFEGIINYSAATIAWLKDQLKLIADPAETEVAAASVADNGGVYLVPAFAGLSAPYWSPDARAAIVGMSAHSNRGHVIRAAPESIAYQIRDVLDMMRSQAGVDLKTIHADGGATRNRFLMQFIADITRLDVTAAPMPDCSPLGAAMAGALGMGVYKSLEELGNLPRGDAVTYKPSMPLDQADKCHAGWKRAVNQVLAAATARAGAGAGAGAGA